MLSVGELTLAGQGDDRAGDHVLRVGNLQGCCQRGKGQGYYQTGQGVRQVVENGQGGWRMHQSCSERGSQGASRVPWWHRLGAGMRS